MALRVELACHLKVLDQTQHEHLCAHVMQKNTKRYTTTVCVSLSATICVLQTTNATAIKQSTAKPRFEGS